MKNVLRWVAWYAAPVTVGIIVSVIVATLVLWLGGYL